MAAGVVSGAGNLPPVPVIKSDLVESLQILQDNGEVTVNYSPYSVSMSLADDMAALLSAFLQNRQTGRKEENLSPSMRKSCEEVLAPKRPQGINQIRRTATQAGMNSKTFSAFLKQMFPDAMQLALFLQAMIRKKKLNIDDDDDDELDDISLALLEETLEQVLNGPEKKRVRAGLNTETQTQQFASLLQQDGEVLRQFYHDFISLHDTPVEIYRQMGERFGTDNISRALEYMSQALHADIGSYDPSCSKSEFSLLLEAGYRLNLLKSSSEYFINQLKKKEVIGCLGNKQDVILNDYFIKLAQEPENGAQHTLTFIKQVTQFLSNTDKIAFMQDLRVIIATFPAALFANEQLEGERLKGLLDSSFFEMMDELVRINGGAIYYE